MTYEQLVDFVENRMRMPTSTSRSCLWLCSGGSTREIARAILAQDESQLEYYEDAAKNMVGCVLKNHGIVEKLDGDYLLAGYKGLEDGQAERLIGLCEEKLEEYKTRRGVRICSTTGPRPATSPGRSGTRA